MMREVRVHLEDDQSNIRKTSEIHARPSSSNQTSPNSSNSQLPNLISNRVRRNSGTSRKLFRFSRIPTMLMICGMILVASRVSLIDLPPHGTSTSSAHINKDWDHGDIPAAEKIQLLTSARQLPDTSLVEDSLKSELVQRTGEIEEDERDDSDDAPVSHIQSNVENIESDSAPERSIKLNSGNPDSLLGANKLDESLHADVTPAQASASQFSSKKFAFEQFSTDKLSLNHHLPANQIVPESHQSISAAHSSSAIQHFNGEPLSIAELRAQVASLRSKVHPQDIGGTGSEHAGSSEPATFQREPPRTEETLSSETDTSPAYSQDSQNSNIDILKLNNESERLLQLLMGGRASMLRGLPTDLSSSSSSSSTNSSQSFEHPALLESSLMLLKSLPGSSTAKQDVEELSSSRASKTSEASQIVEKVDIVDSDAESEGEGKEDEVGAWPVWTKYLKADIDFTISLKNWRPEPGVTLAGIESGEVLPSSLQNFSFVDVHGNGTSKRISELEAEFLVQLEKEDVRPKFSTCAVVGNSGTLLGKGLGEVIDAHQAVMRINYSPTKGFEDDVGKKTTFDLVNKENCKLLTQGEHAWRDSTVLLFESHSRIIRKQVYKKFFKSFARPKEHRVMMLNPVLVTLSRSTFNAIKTELELETRGALTGKEQDPAKVALAKQMFAAKLASASTKDESTTKEGFAFHPKPMSGIVAIYAALQMCDKIEMYGFDPYSESSSTPYHYFDDRVAMTWVHSFDLAIEVYRRIGKYFDVTLNV